jgi:hypothetical protein
MTRSSTPIEFYRWCENITCCSSPCCSVTLPPWKHFLSSWINSFPQWQPSSFPSLRFCFLESTRLKHDPEYLTLNHILILYIPIFRIIPQAICSRWGLAVGGNVYWLVWGVIFVTFPISWPISKILDLILGHRQANLFKRNRTPSFFHSFSLPPYPN